MKLQKKRSFVTVIIIILLFIVISTSVIAKVATYQVGGYLPKDSHCQKEMTCQLGATGSTHYVIDIDKNGKITSVLQGDSQGNYVSVGSVKESQMTMGSNTIKIDYWTDKPLEPAAELKAEKNVDPDQLYKVQISKGEVTVKGKLIGGLRQEEVAFVQSCDSSHPNPACSTPGGREQYQETKDKIDSVVQPVLDKVLPKALEIAKSEAVVEVGAGVHKAMQVMEKSETSLEEDVSGSFTSLFADMNQLAAAGNIAAERAQPKVTEKVNDALAPSGIQVSDDFTEDLVDEQRDNWVPSVPERGSAFLLEGVAWGVAAAGIFGPGFMALTGTTATSAGVTAGATASVSVGTGVGTIVVNEAAQNMDAVVKAGINVATGNYLEAGVEAVSIPFGYYGGKFVRWAGAKLLAKGAETVTTTAVKESEKVVEEMAKKTVGATAKTAEVVSPFTGELEEQVVSPTGEVLYEYFSTMVDTPKLNPILERVLRTGSKETAIVAAKAGKRTVNKMTGMSLVEAEKELFAEGEEAESHSCHPGESCDLETSVPVGEGNLPQAPVAFSNCDPKMQHCMDSSYSYDPNTGEETYAYDPFGECNPIEQSCGSVELTYPEDGKTQVKTNPKSKKEEPVAELDSDLDGVPDSIDQYPGIDDLADADNDGIPDELDPDYLLALDDQPEPICS